MRKELEYRDISFKEFLRRFFSQEYKEQLKQNREVTLKQMSEFYSKIDSLTNKSSIRRRIKVELPHRKVTPEEPLFQEGSLSLSSISIISKSILTTLSFTILVATISTIFIVFAGDFEGLLTHRNEAILIFGGNAFLLGAFLFFWGSTFVLSVWAYRSRINRVNQEVTPKAALSRVTSLFWSLLIVGFILTLVSLMIASNYLPNTFSF